MEKKSKILYAASTASHLERFHQPYLQALRKEASVFTMATGDGVDFPILFDKRFFSISNLRSILQIRKILKHERFDALLLHTTLAAFLIRMALIGLRHRPYVLNVVHGYLFGITQRGMKDRVLLFCEKLLKRQTDSIAVMNAEDWNLAKVHRLCRGKVYFLRGMGAPIEEAAPCPEEALRERLSLRSTDFVCTFVGELSGRKNQIFLIRATKLLRDRSIPCKLVLVGEGSEREALETEIRKLGLEQNVILAGSQSPVLPYLSMTHLYVSASQSEGLPFNIMEAMACGLPILASKTKGQTDLLKDVEDALYPPDDMTAFCDAAERIYRSGQLGVGNMSYPTLKQYLLPSVFEENLKILKERGGSL